MLPDDTEASLHERIKAVERRLYPPRVIEEVPGDDERAPAVRLRQDRRRRAGRRAARARAGRWSRAAARPRRWPRPACPSPTWPSSPAFPAILGHRVVTLHPEGARRPARRPRRPEPPRRPGRATASSRSTSSSSTSTRSRRSPGIELIDIGGPAMVRAAAKNHAHVGVVVDPADYEPGARRAARRPARSRAATRRRLARKAFAHTAAYDAAIVDVARRRADRGRRTAAAPAARRCHLARSSGPRSCATARTRTSRAPATARVGARSWWDDAVQHGGKELSYLNLYDTEAAWRLVHRFDEPAAVIVKHANPCGVAVADDITDAYVAGPRLRPGLGLRRHRGRQPAGAARRWPRRWPRCSPRSSWRRRSTTTPWPCCTAKKNLRVLSAPPPGRRPLDVRTIDGGLLVQERRPGRRSTASAGGSSTKAQPDRGAVATTSSWPGRCARRCRSNAIVLVEDGQAVGIGAGQQNRVDSARIAAEQGRRAGGRAACCASDAFFPFRDGLDAVAAAGVRAVIQPGGACATTR